MDTGGALLQSFAQKQTIETLISCRQTNHEHSCAVAPSLLVPPKLSPLLFLATNLILSLLPSFL